MEDKHRVVIQRDEGHHVTYTTREVGQYLVVESSTGIIVIWDKRTTVFIKLAPSYKVGYLPACPALSCPLLASPPPPAVVFSGQAPALPPAPFRSPRGACLLQGTVCGLCGNFDDHSNNDFTRRDHMVVSSGLDFGNSWKEAPTCPDVSTNPEPCSLNPHRRSWAEKQCSILKSDVFSICHGKVGWPGHCGATRQSRAVGGRWLWAGPRAGQLGRAGL